MYRYKYIYLKCERAHEKHMPQVVFAYRLCVMFTLGSFAGFVISSLLS